MDKLKRTLLFFSIILASTSSFAQSKLGKALAPDFVNLQYYYGGGIALEYGIREVSNVNTDNILKTKNKQNGEAESDSAIA